MKVRSFTTFTLSRGSGVYGALGLDASLKDIEFFNVIRDLSLENIRRVSSGWGHSAASSEGGSLFVFGRPFDFATLLRINRLRKINKSMARFVASSSNSIVFGPTPVGYFPTPMKIATLDKIEAFSCSAGLTIYLNHVGEIYSFGQNRYNQCGLEVKEFPTVYEPERVPNLPLCSSVDVGLQHVVALSTKGELFAWGKTGKGQLGIGIADDLCSLAVRVELDKERPSLRAKSVCAGFYHSAALAEDGAIYVWGKGMSDKPVQRSKRFLVIDCFTP